MKNKASYGIAGKILRVDLGNGKIIIEPTEKYSSNLIGGRAVNSLILLNETAPHTKWSDPENMIIIGVGCLVGTLAPGACRVSIDTISAYGNGKGSANFGGHFGPELKYAGFDHVIITGISKKAVYLWIQDGKVEIRDAESLCGMTTYDTETMIRKELGDPKIQVASIGPAGENLVRGSIVFTNPGKAAGGSGVGCVMGSKRIKAIAVRGHGSVSVADSARFMSAVNTGFDKIKASPDAESWRKGIIEHKFLPESPVWDGYASPRNGQDEYWPMNKRETLVGMKSGVPSYKKRMMACFGCPIGCMPFNEIQNGKYKGIKGAGYWINSALYSTKLDIEDPGASISYHLLCNQLGLDGDMASVSLAWAYECFEKGLLTKSDCDGLELRWGDGDTALKMLRKLANRDGIGDFLADGVKNSAMKLGKGSDYFATHMKGQDSVDPYRAFKGWGFGVSISPVGGRHLRGAVSAPEVTGPKNIKWSAFEYENVPDVVFWQSQAKEIEDITGICIYNGTWSGVHALELSDYFELISSAMGIKITEEEFMTIARRGINLEKAFNTLHTEFDRTDDYPPIKYMEEPIKSGPFAGDKCEKEIWDEMLDRFYELNGWDLETGLQTSECLKNLDLEFVAEKLKDIGKLK
jgi:aldehyde:ferredoxin oxidoreductase